MTAPDTSMDRPLHLSLPDWRTALKRRVKRPKRPGFWFWWTLVYVGFAVWSFIDRDWLGLACISLAIGYGWWMVANGRDRIVWRYYAPLLVVLWIPFVRDLVS